MLEGGIMKEHRFGPKETGAALIILSVALVFVFASSTREIMKSENIACGQVCGIDMDTNGADCPHKNSIPIQSYAGFSMSFIIGGIGASMILSARKYGGIPIEDKKKMEKIVGSLGDDEKKIYGILKDGNGGVFQSELIGKAGFTKVKVSRVLDKLEGKGIIERKRRGMTNMVSLQQYGQLFG